MTEVPVLFFQVCATAIPTLLIAIGVGAKYGEVLGNIVESEKTGGRVFIVGLSLSIPALVAAAELASLLCVVTKGGPIWVGMSVLFVVNILVHIIGLEITGPVFMKVPKSWELTIGIAVMASFLVTTGVAFLLLRTLAGS